MVRVLALLILLGGCANPLAIPQKIDAPRYQVESCGPGATPAAGQTASNPFFRVIQTTRSCRIEPTPSRRRSTNFTACLLSTPPQQSNSITGAHECE